MRPRRSATVRRATLLLACSGGLLARRAAARPAADVPRPELREEQVLTPDHAVSVDVAIGEALFFDFSCRRLGPADVVISLSTYAEHADPLLYLSANRKERPTFQRHDASSFGQWKEDAAGDHYVIAKGVSPEGGILGLVNLEHFAGETLRGILSLHCTVIVAFDALFWDHLRSSTVCPVGGRGPAGPRGFCSSHGRCGRHGVCKCDADHAGAACEHRKDDVVVAAEGRYTSEVAANHYQYFRVRVPPRFAGGYLQITTKAEHPLVVLVKDDAPPKKTDFTLSNFDDWVNRRITSVLRYSVHSAGDAGYPMGAPPPGPAFGLPGLAGLLPPAPPAAPGRRLGGGGGSSEPWPPPPSSGRRPGASLPWPASAGNGSRFAGAPGEAPGLQPAASAVPARGLQLGPEVLHLGREARDLQPGPVDVTCPAVVLDASGCHTAQFATCRLSCMNCVACVEGGDSQRSCPGECEECLSRICGDALAVCAGDKSCDGSEARMCKESCGKCNLCFDNSNDPKCAGCRCCVDCLPLGAKCDGRHPVESNRFVFVGVYNHRRWQADRRSVVKAVVEVKLTEDPAFRYDLPVSWVADLYNPWQDITSLAFAKTGNYPADEQVVYELSLVGDTVSPKLVRLFRDRVILVKVANHVRSHEITLQLSDVRNIMHMLSSSKSAPKTLFDFDQVLMRQNQTVTIVTHGEPTIWCAIFGAADGHISVAAKAAPEGARAVVSLGVALLCGLGLAAALVVLGFVDRGATRIGECLGLDVALPLGRSGASTSLVRHPAPHENTAVLIREGSLSGYVASDDVDQSVEDQHLHRGGVGDDGI